MAQRHGWPLPGPRVGATAGPEHQKEFTVECWVLGEMASTPARSARSSERRRWRWPSSTRPARREWRQTSSRRDRHEPGHGFVPELRWPERVAAVAAVLGAAGADLERVWIVGGAVRDALLGRPVHDLDLATAGGGLSLARAVADQLGGAFYPLDESRGCGRAVLPGASGADTSRFEVDVTDLRASSLAGDLAERDFTINAMAVPLADLQAIVDPLGGRADLAGPAACAPLRRRRRSALTACAASAACVWPRSSASPSRRRRAPGYGRRRRVRAGQTAERVGAELLKCFAAPGTATALADLLVLDLLAIMVPEVAPMVGSTQSPPHRHDVWDHTLQVVASAERLRDLAAGGLPSDD